MALLSGAAPNSRRTSEILEAASINIAIGVSLAPANPRHAAGVSSLGAAIGECRSDSPTAALVHELMEEGRDVRRLLNLVRADFPPQGASSMSWESIRRRTGAELLVRGLQPDAPCGAPSWSPPTSPSTSLDPWSSGSRNCLTRRKLERKMQWEDHERRSAAVSPKFSHEPHEEWVESGPSRLSSADPPVQQGNSLNKRRRHFCRPA